MKLLKYNCEQPFSSNCRAVAFYSTDNGRNWKEIESYVNNCNWARDKHLEAVADEIICESFASKEGSQKATQSRMELVVGSNYFDKNRRKKVFEEVVGFAKFSEYMVVAAVSDFHRYILLWTEH